MPSVDNKVVNIEFNNSQFEKAISSTISSLGELKENLNFKGATDGIEEIEQAVDDINFAPMEQGIQEVQASFSALEVIAVTVLANIANSIYNTITGALNASIGTITSDVISGGFNRALSIEQAEFALEGLGYDVELAMESCSAAVNDTAFGLDEAASACANLAASGIQLGDDMTRSLTAISGVAAQTSSDYSSIANIFSTVAGQGKLMTLQLNSLAYKGLNAAATIADYLGTTEQKVREMVTAGKIDFQTFSDAMYDAFGEHAMKANETFSGALANMHAALKKIGADFFEQALDPMRRFFLGCRSIFNAVRTYVKPASDFLASTLDDVVSKFEKMVEKIVTIDENYDDEGLLTGYTYHFSDGCQKMLDALQAFAQGVINLFNAIGSVIGPIFKAFSKYLGDNLVDSIYAVAEGFEAITKHLGISSKQAGKWKNTWANLSEAFSNVVDIIGEFISILTGTAFTGGVEVFSSITDWLVEIAYRFSMVIKKASQALKAFLELDSTQEVLGKIAEAFQTIVGFAQNAWEHISKFVDKLVNTDLMYVTYDITNALNDVSGAGEILGNIFDKLSGYIQRVVDIVQQLVNWLKQVAQQGLDVIKPIFDNILGSFNINLSSFDSVLESIGGLLGSLTGLIGGGLDTAIDTILTWIETIVSRLSNIGFFDLLAAGGAIYAILQVLSAIKFMFMSAYNITVIAKNMTKKLKKAAGSMTSISNILKSLALVLFAVVLLANQDPEALENAVNTIVGLLVTIGVMIAAVNKIGAVAKTSIAFIAVLSLCLFLLSAALLALTLLSNPGDLILTVGVLAALMAAMTLMLLGVNKAGAAAITSVVFIGVLSLCLILLSAALIALTLFSNPLDLILTVGVLTALMAAMTLMLLGVNKAGAAAITSVVFIGVLSLCLILLSAALIPLTLLTNVGDLFLTVLVLGVLMAEMAVMLQTCADVGPVAAVGALALVILTVCLTLISLALIPLTVLTNPLDLIATVAALSLLWWELFAMLGVLSVVGPAAISGSVALVAIGAALLLMAIALTPLTMFTDPADLALTTLALIPLFVELGLLLLAIGPLGALSTLGMFASIKLFACLTLLVLALVPLTALTSAGDLFVTVLILGLLMAEMYAMLLVISKLDGPLGSATTALIKLALALTLLSLGLTVLSRFGNPDNMMESVIALGALMLEMAATLIIIQGVQGPASGAIPALIAMSIVIALLGVVLGVLSNYVDPSALLPTVVALGLLMLSMSASLLLVSKAGKVAGKAIVSMLLITACMAALGLVIVYILDQVSSAEDALIICAAISLLMLTMAAVLAICAVCGEGALAAMPALALIEVAVAAMALIFYLISKIENVVGVVILVYTMIDMFTAMAALLVICTALGPFAGAAEAGVLAMIGVVTQLGAFIVGLGALVDLVPDLVGLAQIAANFLQTIGEAIGSFIGGIVGGAVSAALDGIGTALSDFMITASGFFEGCANLDPSSITSAVSAICDCAIDIGTASLSVNKEATANLADLGSKLPNLATNLVSFANMMSNSDKSSTAISLLADLLNAFGSFGSSGADASSLEALASNLPTIAEGLVGYSDALSEGFDATVVNSSTTPLKNIVTALGNVPSSGGFLENITGSSSMDSFADNLKSMGEAMHNYSMAVSKGFNAPIVQSTIDPLNDLISALSSVPTEGGLLGDILGSNSTGMENFASNLELIGNALVSYSKALTEEGAFNQQVVTDSIDPLSSLITTLSEIPNEGGLLGDIMGSQATGMENFALNLGLIAAALVSYSRALTEEGAFNQQVVTDSIDPLSSLVTTLSEIPNEGGLLGNIMGSNSGGISDFANNLGIIGEALASYSKAVSAEGAFNKETVDSSIESLSNLITALSGCNTSGGLLSKLFGNNDLSGFASGLEDIGTGLGKFSEKADEAGVDTINSAITALQDLVNVVQNIDTESLSTTASSLKTALKTLAEGIKQFGNGLGGDSSVARIETTFNALRTLSLSLNGMETFSGMDLDTFSLALGNLALALNTFTTNVSQETVTLLTSIVGCIASFDTVATTINTVAESDYIGFNLALTSLSLALLSFSSAAATFETLSIDLAAFETLGANIISAITTGLTMSSSETIESTLTTILSNIASIISTYDIITAANTFASSFANTIKTTLDEAALPDKFTSIIDAILTAISDKYKEIKQAGKDLVKKFSDGITNGCNTYKGTIISAFNTMLSSVVSSLQGTTSSKFSTLGYYACKGFADGISNNSYLATSAGTSLGNAAYNAAASAIQAHSPSERMKKLGMFFDQGAAIGILDNVNVVTDAAQSMMESTVAIVQNVLDNIDENDLSPVITPILDATEFYKNFGMLTNDLSYVQQASGSTTKYFDAQLAASTPSQPSQIVNNYDFTQNNTSPRALNREELYRQTKNQFTRFRNRVTV